MSLFAVLLRDAQSEAIKTELKWLAGELGPARELEVLINRVVAPVKRRRRRWRGMPSLSQELAERRDAALARAQDAVQSARFRALTIDIAAWLQAGQWTNPPDDLADDREGLPIKMFASEQLARRWRKVRKKGKVLTELDPPSRHKLRIEAALRSRVLRRRHCSGPSGRRNGASNSFSPSSACRMHSATSTTLLCTKNESQH
jgi:triphosphatase